MMNKYYLACFMVVASVLATAQTDSTRNQGEVVSGEIIIEKNKQIVLPKADKVFQPGDLLRLDTESIAVQLHANEPKLEWPAYTSAIPIVKGKKPQPAGKSYANYARIGYGNFGSPLAQVGIYEQLGSFKLRNQLSYERFASGPVGGSNSASSITSLSLSGTYASETFTVTPFLNVGSQGFRFYGNTDRLNPGFSNSNVELPRNRYSTVDFGVRLSGRSGNVSYRVTPHFGTTAQKPSDEEAANKENQGGVEGAFSLAVDKFWMGGMQVQALAAGYEGGIEYSRSLVQATPWIGYKKNSYELRAGINVASTTSDTLDHTGVYPNISGAYQLDDNWKLLGHLKGGVAWQGLGDRLDELQFLDDSLQLLNTQTKISFGGGISGTLLKNLQLDAGIDFSNLENLPFFVPSAADSAKYSLAYDNETVQRIAFTSKVQYTPSRNAVYVAALQLNSYEMSSLDRAWHLPLYTFSVSTSHTIKEKVLVSTRLIAMGGIRAPTTVAFGIEELDPIIDLGLTVDYRINKRLSAFIATTNLLNQEYERYLGYPVRGAAFKIGGQYRF